MRNRIEGAVENIGDALVAGFIRLAGLKIEKGRPDDLNIYRKFLSQVKSSLLIVTGESQSHDWRDPQISEKLAELANTGVVIETVYLGKVPLENASLT